MTSNQRKKVVAGFIVLYSVVVMASSTPRFGDISNVPVIVYYMFVPGFSFTLLLRENYNVPERIAYSVILSLGATLSLLAIRGMIYPESYPLPFDVVIPMITIIVTAYYYFLVQSPEVKA